MIVLYVVIISVLWCKYKIKRNNNKNDQKKNNNNNKWGKIVIKKMGKIIK